MLMIYQTVSAECAHKLYEPLAVEFTEIEYPGKYEIPSELYRDFNIFSYPSSARLYGINACEIVTIMR